LRQWTLNFSVYPAHVLQNKFNRKVSYGKCKNLPRIYSLTTVRNLVVVSRTLSFCVRMLRRSQKFGHASWGLILAMSAWLTRRNMLLSHPCHLAKFGHSRSNHTSVIMDICQKNLTPQGLSRSLEPTRIDRLPLTSY